MGRLGSTRPRRALPATLERETREELGLVRARADSALSAELLEVVPGAVSTSCRTRVGLSIRTRRPAPGLNTRRLSFEPARRAHVPLPDVYRGAGTLAAATVSGEACGHRRGHQPTERD
jgi:8-oxo-dGTP pyrophosphatase MutT (NUDIX family)